MTKLHKVQIKDPGDDWEDGKYGRDEKHVEVAPEEIRKQVDESLELHLISIRLQQQLIDGLKLIADYRGIGYQPLIRDALGRFARSEILQIANELREQQKAQEIIEKEQQDSKKRA